MWPDTVKSKAMLLCGRRCCICHKFTGTKMECHHIQPKKQRGRDTDANCIPLCFDCHAEVGHYNENHPKGIKFSPEELRGHRDRWYETIAKGKNTDAPDDHHNLDLKLFWKLHQILGGSESMLHFRDHNYGYSYRIQVEDGIDSLMHITEFPENQFYDAQLDSALGDLKAAILGYKKSFANRVFSNGDIAHVPPEWLNRETSQEKRYLEAVEVMNTKSTKIWEAFAQFVKIARYQLNIHFE